MNNTKVCTKCGTEKPLEDFGRHLGAKDGKMSRCKKCVNEWKREYHRANREKRLAQQKAWREKSKEQQRAYRQANREKRNEQSKEYYQANKARILALEEANKREGKESPGIHG